jgi:hypothetical protein
MGDDEMPRTLTDLEYKDTWSAEDHAVYRFGSRDAAERARAKANIKQLQRRLAKCSDKTEEAEIIQSLGEWQDYLTKLTPPTNYQLAAE